MGPTGAGSQASHARLDSAGSPDYEDAVATWLNEAGGAALVIGFRPTANGRGFSCHSDGGRERQEERDPALSPNQ